MAKKKCTLKGNARIEAIRELLQMSDSASMEDVRVGSFRPQGDADEILDLRSLALQREGRLLKLAVSDDNGVIPACGNAGAKCLAVGRLEILLRGSQNVGSGIEC